MGSAEASETLRPYLEHAEWAMFEHVTGLLGKMKSRAVCQVLVEYTEDIGIPGTGVDTPYERCPTNPGCGM